MGTHLAPIYNKLWKFRRQNQVRLPDPEFRKFIHLMLQDPFIFMINIFDTADPVGGTQGVALAAQTVAESRFTCPEDFWWFGTAASYTVGSAANPPFSFQLFSAANVAGSSNTTQSGNLFQQNPINAPNFFGTGQEPFYLKAPKLFRQNTEVMCTVQNLQNAANTIQIVLLGCIGEPAGGLT